jgi:YggT family protein
MRALFWLLDTAISLYVWALIIAAVLSMLLAFNVLDTRNRFVWNVADFFYRVTEPALRPIRRRMPNLGGVDLSPLVLILVLQALRILLATSIAPALGVYGY